MKLLLFLSNISKVLERRERQWKVGEIRSHMTELLWMCACVCTEVVLWEVGNVGELNILAVILLQGKDESMKYVSCSKCVWWWLWLTGRDEAALIPVRTPGLLIRQRSGSIKNFRDGNVEEAGKHDSLPWFYTSTDGQIDRSASPRAPLLLCNHTRQALGAESQTAWINRNFAVSQVYCIRGW